MFGFVLLKALREPLRDPNWWRKVGLGGILSMLPLLGLALAIAGQIAVGIGVGFVGLFFLVIAWGYLFRVFVDTLNGFEMVFLPEWTDWKAYGLAGLWLFLIVLGYGFFAVIGLTALTSVLGLMPSTENPEELFGISMLMLMVLVIFYGFFPIVFARFSAERSLWAAFDPGAIWEDLREVVNGVYVQTCFGFFGLLMMGNVVLGALPGIGMLLGSMYGFFMSVVFVRIFGTMIRAAKQQKKSNSKSEDDINRLDR